MTAPAPTTSTGSVPLAGTRLLVLCDYLSAHPGGGAERVALEVSRRLVSDLGAEVRLVGGVPGPGGEHVVGGVTLTTAPAHDLSGRVGAQLALSRALPRLAASLVRTWQPTALLAHSLHFESAYVAAALAWRHRLPLVLTVHVAGLEALPPHVRAVGAAFEQSGGRVLLRRATRVIAVSEPVAEHARRRGARASDVRIVPNGVDVDAFHPGARRAADPPVALFVGRLIANKGPHLFVEALRRVRGEGVDVVGRLVGGGPQSGALQAQIDEAGLRDAVTLTGHLDDIRPELARATVLVRPSSTEGMPLAVLEAMASGVPVLASDLAANRALLHDGVDGALFATGDVGDLSRALAALLASPATLERLAVAGRRTAERHTWSACAHGTAAVVAEAIAADTDRERR